MNVLYAKSAKAIQSTEWLSSSTLTNMSTIIRNSEHIEANEKSCASFVRNLGYLLYQHLGGLKSWYCGWDTYSKTILRFWSCIFFLFFNLIHTNEMMFISAPFIGSNVNIPYPEAVICEVLSLSHKHKHFSSVWQSRSFMRHCSMFNSYWISSSLMNDNNDFRTFYVSKSITIQSLLNRSRLIV